MKKFPIWKLIGWSILIHVILIALSIVEVVIYSTLINPGQDKTHYEEHAQTSAPIISIVLGIIIFFLVARRLSKNYWENKLTVALALALSYIILDIVILQVSDTDWGENFLVFVISFSTKIAASVLGALSAKRQSDD